MSQYHKMEHKILNLSKCNINNTSKYIPSIKLECARPALWLIVFLLSLAFTAQAQQDEQYTQFMFNKLWYNPAYAGSDGLPNLTLVARNQWIGLKGAPQSQALTFDLPLLNDRVGVGGNIVHNKIAVYEEMTVDGSYAYRLKLGQGIMGLGVQASVRFLRNDFTELEATQPVSSDGAIPVGIQSKFVPNFGMGFYYHTEAFYLGFSVPRLLNTNIDLADNSVEISREVQHFYLMGGVILGEKDFKFLPQVLVKYTPTAPLDADLNLSFILLDKITIGGTYRLGGAKENPIGESIGLVFASEINESLLLGLSYDLTLTPLKEYQDGSVEVALRYTFGNRSAKIGTEYTNPRHF